MYVYATDERGARFLRYIECDVCAQRIAPAADIAQSGWVKCGYDRGPGTERLEWNFCPDHAPSESEWRGRVRAFEARGL
jgi:hypothetical protein